MMKTTYDEHADILMIELVEDLAVRRASGHKLPFGDTYLDLDQHGAILGIEIMDAGKKYPREALQQHPKPPEQLSLAEAARLAGLQPQALRKACERGRLVGQKIGRDWIITVAALNDYLNSRVHEGPGSAIAG